MIRDPNKPSRASKSRSKSRSPGRPIEEDRSVGGLRSSVGGGSVHAGHGRTSSSHGNSPDNISESSASFHENEFIPPVVPPHFRVVPSSSHPRHPHHSTNVVPMVHQGSSSSSASAANISVSANNPWMPQYANRDSVRESWISSGSSEVHPYHVHSRYQHQQHYHQHHQRVHVPVAQVSSEGTSDASNKSLASSGGGGGGIRTHDLQSTSIHHQTLIQRPMHPQQQQQSQITSKMTGTLPRGTKVVTSSSMTLPRSSKAMAAVTGPPPTHKNMYQSRPAGPVLPPPAAQPPVQAAGMRSSAAGGSRESGSSSSRTVSRSGSRCALSKSGSRSGSSSALQKARPGTPEGNFSYRKCGLIIFQLHC